MTMANKVANQLSQHRATMVSAQLNFKVAHPGADPIVKQLGSILQQNAGFVLAICDKAGMNRHTIRKWLRGGADPTLSRLRATLNAVGYDLRIVKIYGKAND